MNEKLIERKLREEVQRLGGLALKFSSPFFTGMPDRIVLLPGGKVRFAEIKSTKKNLSDRQDLVKGQLEKLGLTVRVLDSQETLDCFLNEIRK